jgi:hypothetical protein
MNLSRRSLLSGLIAAPAVILTPGLLMPVKPWIQPEALVGDMIYDREPLMPRIGWLCTVSGTPGTWVEIGSLVSGQPAGRSMPPLGARRDAVYRRIEPRPDERMIRFA